MSWPIIQRCGEHPIDLRLDPVCTDSAVLRLRRQLHMLRVASVIALPLAVINDGLAGGTASNGRVEAMPAVQTEATLIRSAYVQFDERKAAGGSFGPVASGLGNSQASEPTRNIVEYQVISVPRVSF
ncbi:hypothetical protein D9M72_334990 [compost metagenome]